MDSNGDTTSYEEFLASKTAYRADHGFRPGPLPGFLFPFQATIVEWACLQGRCAIWADTGLGKTGMQLAWAEQVYRKTNKDILILCPLAVARQTSREAEKFGLESPVTVCRTGADAKPGINVTNYQMLKHFDVSRFGGVVVDESDILANFSGKVKKLILESFRETPFKLDCSATPAPNDHMEIGNHADFLGAMAGHEMLSRWFINDGREAGKYVLKAHGVDDFWRWVSSWAVAVGKPSDLGCEDGAYDLPPLRMHQHVVEVDNIDGRQDGFLFRMPSMSATGMHKEMRRTAADRAAAVADLVRSFDPEEVSLIWCHTDYESDALRGLLPDAVEVKGTQSIEEKESRLDAFSLGQVKTLISKPSICGHGMNWQHCRKPIFMGLDYSFKGFYQAIRRNWRFGQSMPVDAHIFMAETEGRLLDTIQRKQSDYEAMKRSMIAAMKKHGLGSQSERYALEGYNPTVTMKLPDWLQPMKEVIHESA
jgi:hypothetical protein